MIFLLKPLLTLKSDFKAHNLFAARVADYKKIRGRIFFVEDYPRTPSGKVLRRKLKEIAEKELKESNPGLFTQN